MTTSAHVKQLVQVLINASPATPVSPTTIASAMAQALSILPPASREGLDPDLLLRELETMYMVTIGESRTLGDNSDHVEWLEQRRHELNWGFWKRYWLLLKERMPAKAVEGLDRTTDEILGRLENPTREGSWDRRGLVVGNVQSGKTGNYTGLICKAADAGYKVVIVLTGLHSSLRSQTQIRLDEGFLGYESHQSLGGGRKFVGVGNYDKSLPVDCVTSREESGDFRLSFAQQFNISPGGHPLLFVVKKNARVLQNLLGWVVSIGNAQDSAGYMRIRNVPLLVVDDEADNASVDTKEQGYNEDGEPDEDYSPTRINGLIRELMNRFEKRAYVGYTATPFANIFIHESGETKQHGEDLFPKSFIMNLPASSDYVGPVRVFGVDADPDAELEESDGLPLCRTIGNVSCTPGTLDAESEWMPPKHKKTHRPTYQGEARLPPSLTEAVHQFVLASAARRARGQVKVHNSMLVHVTRFTDVQDEVFKQVQAEVNWLRDRLKRGEGRSKTSVLASLENLWANDFIETSKAMLVPKEDIASWAQVEAHLIDVVESISVRKINGKASDTLDYDRHRDTGLTVIAVGGDKLSRGLTLEGLSVSYFLRASKMYDTLMQMGRWFGYRPGYVDLCRLFLTEELEEWFRHVTTASEELRLEFDRMVALGQTPRDYGLKVMSHPVLAITSQVKMRHGEEINLSYQGTVSETIAFETNASRQGNFDHLRSALASFGTPETDTVVRPRNGTSGDREERWLNSPLWTEVDAFKVSAFLRGLRTPKEAVRASGTLMSQYIDKQVNKGELTKWTVALLSSRHPSAEPYDVGPYSLKLIKRQNLKKGMPGSYKIRRLLSPRDEGIDIGSDAYARALAETKETWSPDPQKSSSAEPDHPSGPSLRNQRPSSHGLLLIYVIDPIDPDVREVGTTPFVGVGVSWPGSKTAEPIKYSVNNVYYEQEFLLPFEEEVA